jgi:hypothetical protein
MGTTEATADSMASGGGAGTVATTAQPVATPQLPPMGKKPAGVGQHARQFDMPDAEEIHKYRLRHRILRAGILNWLRFTYDFEIGPAVTELSGPEF